MQTKGPGAKTQGLSHSGPGEHLHLGEEGGYATHDDRHADADESDHIAGHAYFTHDWLVFQQANQSDNAESHSEEYSCHAGQPANVMNEIHWTSFQVSDRTLCIQ